MFTTQQIATVNMLLLHLHKKHVSDLLSLTNELIVQIDPQQHGKLRGIFDAVVPDTAKAISAFGNRLVEEVYATVSGLKARLDESERDQVLALCKPFLNPELYSKRLSIFKAGIERKLQSYGLTFEPKAYRFDLIDSRYEVGALNQTRSILAQLKNRLDVLVYADNPATISQPSEPAASVLAEANQIVDLRPNFFGIGVNLNHLVGKWLRRCK